MRQNHVGYNSERTIQYVYNRQSSCNARIPIAYTIHLFCLPKLEYNVRRSKHIKTHTHTHIYTSISTCLYIYIRNTNGKGGAKKKTIYIGLSFDILLK